MVVNKKGIQFSLISVLLATLFLITFSSRNVSPQVENLRALENRANSINSHLNDVENFLDLVVRQATLDVFRGYNSYINYTKNQTGNPIFIDDVKCSFEQAILNGTYTNLGGTPAHATERLFYDLVGIDDTNDPDSGSPAVIDTFKLEQNEVLVQKFIAESSSIPTTLRVKSHVNGGPENIYVYILGDCKKVYAKGVQAMNNNGIYDIPLTDTSLLFEGQEYYLVISNPSNKAVKFSPTENPSKNPNPTERSTNSDYAFPDFEGKTLGSWLDKVANVSSETLHIPIKYEVLSVHVSQKKPWELEVLTIIRMEAKDLYFTLNKTITHTTIVPIEGLHDPLYFLSDGTPRRVQRFSKVLSSSRWNITFLHELYQERTYRFFAQAPSIIMRFENNISESDCCGIESFINTSDAAFIEYFSETPPIRINSHADYYFLNGINFSCNVNDTSAVLINYTNSDGDYKFYPEAPNIPSSGNPAFAFDELHLAAFNLNKTHFRNVCS